MYPGLTAHYVYGKAQKCAAVTDLKASSVKGGVKLTWTKSAGAEGYLVYGIHPGEKYGYIGMTTKAQHLQIRRHPAQIGTSTGYSHTIQTLTETRLLVEHQSMYMEKQNN